ncbi:MAG: T9SS type A sorting domain-containing protein [Lewinellaceae bacterium]|nr:T9SS type A sorting domain-containing protein [Lewinellaceae bacterium]
MKHKIQNAAAVPDPAYSLYFSKAILIVMAILLFSVPQELSAQDSCTPPFDYSVTNQEIDDIFPGGGAWPPGSSISVTGKLTINQSTNLDNLEFVMSPNSSIDIVGAGTIVTATNYTRFHGCTQMWRGITVKTGAIVQFDGVNVDDAWQGLIFLSAANTTGSGIKNSFFTDNVIGIGIYGMGSAATPFRFTEFSNNTIEASINPLLPPPSGKTYTSIYPLRGIGITQSVVDLVSGVTAKNRIREHRHGMSVYVSTVMLANFEFNNNQIDPWTTSIYEGIDIYSYRSTLSVGGSLGSTGCTFFSAKNTAIISNETRGLSVSGASFSNPDKFGISCVNSSVLSSPISITGNHFTMNGSKTVSAIQVDRPPSGSAVFSTTIKDNEIEIFSGHQKSPIILIDVVGQFDATDGVSIENNLINVDVTYRRINGIHVSGKGNNYMILNDNQLSWTPNAIPTLDVNTVKSTGIIANDLLGSGHTINGNSVTSVLAGNKSFLRAGIDLSNNFYQTFVCENTTSNTHIGINCFGTLSNTFLKKNNIGNAAYGLFCAVNTAMPHQDRFENVWTGAYATRGAEYEGGLPLFNFFFDPSPLISNDLPPTVLPTSWFLPANGSNSNCGIAELPLVNPEQLLPGGTAGWDAQRMLLYQAIRYPESVSNDPRIEKFMKTSAQANTSAWQFAYAESLYDRAYAPTTAVRVSVGDAAARFGTLSGKIRELDAANAKNTLNVAQNRALLLSQFCQAADELERMREQALPGQQHDLRAALEYCLGLPEATDYERNLKNVLSIATRHALGDSLTGDDHATLRRIASQCPETGGMSVRRAPMWLPREESVLWIDKDWSAGCVTERKQNVDNEINTQNVRVAPNPAADVIQLSFPEGATGRWQIRNMTGTLLQEGQAGDSPVQVATSDWPQGLYFLHWQNQTGIVNAPVKLVISR